MKSLRKMDKFDIKIIPLRWGNTPQNQVSDQTEFGRWMLDRVIAQIGEKPDVFVQVSVANEFEPKGHYNIGVTAGVETTIAPKDFIDGSNKMDLIIVPSNFTKANLGSNNWISTLGPLKRSTTKKSDNVPHLVPATFMVVFRAF